MRNKVKTVKESKIPKNKKTDGRDFNEFSEGWITSEVDLAEVFAIPGVINLVIEHHHNDILQAYKDYCAEQVNS